MPDFEQKIQHCYHNQFFAAKYMGKKNFHRSCLERINLSWFVTTLSSAKTKHLPAILNCRHFDPVCFYRNIMAPIPYRAEITQATLSMRSHFAAVSRQVTTCCTCAVTSRKKCQVSGCRRQAGDVCCLRCLVKPTERRSQQLRLQRVFYVKRSTAAKIPTWQSLTIGTPPLKGWTQAQYKCL